jgi:surface protein
MSSRLSGSRVGQTPIRNSLAQAATAGGSPIVPWVRPSDWPALDTVTAGTQKIQCLIAVRPALNSTTMALTVSGNYAVDWGDGTTGTFSAGTQATKIYDYTNANLGPVTSEGFKTAILTITPQSGQNITSVNLTQILSTLTVAAQCAAPIVELYLNAPSMTGFTNAESVNKAALSMVRHVVWGQMGTPAQELWRDMYALQQIEFPFGVNVAGTSKMFDQCFSLQNIVGTITTTTMQEQFRGCRSLINMPNINWSGAGTATSTFFQSNIQDALTIPGNARPTVSMNSFLSNCRNLRTFADQINLSGVTNMDNMFQNCSSLRKFTQGNLASTTSTIGMFNGCTTLQQVANLSTPALTATGSMFSLCSQLQTAPTITANLVTNMDAMFNNCSQLTSVPVYNTSNVTSMTQTFLNCSSLITAPAWDMTKNTSINGMFQNCRNLVTVPAYNTANVTNFTDAFRDCTSMVEIPITTINANFTLPQARLTANAIANIFNALTSRTVTQTITLAANPGVTTAINLSATSTAGSNLLTGITNTSSLVVGQAVTGTNIVSGVTCSTAVAGNLITLTAHGLTNNTQVSFAGTNVGNTARKIYYVANATANNFQCSLTAGGTEVAVTTTGSTSMFYPRYIASIVANSSVTMTAPASTSGASTVTFRTLDTSVPIMKGWTVSG